MDVRRGLSTVEGRAVLVVLVGCLGAGFLAGAGQAEIVLLLACVAVPGALIVLDRRRMAPLLWAGVALTAPLQGVRVSPFLALSDVLLVAAFLAILPDGLRGWRRVVPAGVGVAFGVLVSAGLVGTFFAPDVGASLLNLVKIILAAAGSVVAMALWDPGPARLRQFAWLWLGGAAASAAWAAVTPRSYGGRALGLTTHPNHFGLVCMLAVGLGLGLALSSARRARMAGLAAVALVIAGVGLSGSRAALLGLAITIALTATLTRRFRLLVVTTLLTTLAGMAILAGIIHVPEQHALSRLAGGGASANSNAERREQLALAFESINRHPFTGEGFEFALVAHNIYVQVLVVGGPIALLSFLAICVLITRAGLRTIRADRGQRNVQVLAGCVAAYVGYLVSSNFDNILWDRYLWTFIGLMLLLAVSTDRRSRSDPRGEASPAGVDPGIEVTGGPSGPEPPAPARLRA